MGLIAITVGDGIRGRDRQRGGYRETDIQKEIERQKGDIERQRQ